MAFYLCLEQSLEHSRDEYILNELNFQEKGLWGCFKILTAFHSSYMKQLYNAVPKSSQAPLILRIIISLYIPQAIPCCTHQTVLTLSLGLSPDSANVTQSTHLTSQLQEGRTSKSTHNYLPINTVTMKSLSALGDDVPNSCYWDWL